MYQIPPLSNEYTFEDLICDLFNSIEKTTSYQTFGTKGQSQKGIDIFGATAVSEEKRTVIQCKKKDISKSDKKNREELEKDFEESLKLSKINEFEYERFILSSTFKNDRNLQEFALKKADELKIKIEYWGWDTISKYLIENKEVLFKYYPAFNLNFTNPPTLVIPFKSESSFKILILPFNIYGDSKTGDFEKALFNYYRTLTNGQENNLEIRIRATEAKSLTLEEAEKIRKLENVDMVIFGSYESDLQGKEVNLQYSSNIFEKEIQDSSRYEFRRLLDIESGYLPNNLHYMVHFTLGLKAYFNCNYNEAISEFHRLLFGFNIIQFDVLIYAAHSFLQIENYKDAKIFYEFASSYDPKSELVYFQLGTINYKLKEYEEALKNYDKGLFLNPKQPDLLYYYGKTLEELNKLDLAKEYYLKSIDEDDSKNMSAYYSLSFLLYKNNDLHESHKYAKKIIKIEPNDYETHNLLGNILSKLNNQRLAMQHLKKAIKLNSQFKEAHNNLGLLNCEMKEFDKAEYHFKIAINIDSSFSTCYCNYGSLLVDIKRFSDAIIILEKAIDLNPKYYRAYNLLGGIYAQHEDFAKAIKNYTLAYIHGSTLALDNIDRLFENYNIPNNFLPSLLLLLRKLDSDQINIFINIYIEMINKITSNNTTINEIYNAANQLVPFFNINIDSEIF